MADRAVTRSSSNAEAAASEDLNQYRIAQQQFDNAAQYVDGLPEGLRDYLRCTTRLTTVEFPIELEDGSVKTFAGYRALHSRVRGPGKGGIRYHPDVTPDEVRALASWMTWIYDTYGRMHSGKTHVPGAPGKPVGLGGSLGRNEAAARGCLFVTSRAIAEGAVPGLTSLSGARVAIQGFGNAGSIAARLFTEAGAKVIAVSDSSGGVRSEDGIDVAAALAHKKQTGSVVGLAGTTNISNDDLLHTECDVLIPAAFENQIRADNVAGVKTKVIAEAANGPTTPAADQGLFARGIPIIPDILANSGGVTVSYFEWVQNIEHENWSEEHVNGHLRTKMDAATDAVLHIQLESKDRHNTAVDLRTAAFALAIKRVTDVANHRGIWP